MKKRSLFTVAFAALVTPVFANVWVGNLNDAKKAAAAQKKDMLIYFSGSGWDSGTKKIESEVFDNEEFKKEAPKSYVLLNFDFPRDFRKDPASAPKVKIGESYGIGRLPTVILADQDGRPYSITGYKKGGAESYLKYLASLKENGAKIQKALADAAGQNGEEKAKSLISAVELTPRSAWETHYAKELEEIKKADPEGKTGFIASIEKEKAVKEERAQYQKLFAAKNYDEVIKNATASLGALKGEDAQRVIMYKIQALAGQKKYAEAKAELDVMGKMAPETTMGKSVDRYKQIVDRMKARDENKAKPRPVAKGGKKKPTGPIVSKPVAVVSDVKVLHDEVSKIKEQLAKAEADKAAKSKVQAENAKKMAELQKSLAALKAKDEATKAEAKKVAEEHAKLQKKLVAMKDVIATHEKMESRKTKVQDLEEKAKALQKQAEELRKKAADLKSGKK